MTKFETEKLINGYNVHLLTSVDGVNYYYCGVGRYCKTENEVDSYIERAANDDIKRNKE